MSKKILPLMGMALLSASAVQGAVLFENPYDPQGTSGVVISNFNFVTSGATTFTLSGNSTIQALSFTVLDSPSSNPLASYGWSIYADVNGMPGGAPGPISPPTGAPTYLPLDSGQVLLNSSDASWRNLVPYSGLYAINEVTLKTGPIDLGAGTYFLALSGAERGVGNEVWESGKYNTGNTSSFFGVFTPVSAGGDALAIYGKALAPEIDASMATTVLTFLLGGLLVLRGHRPKLDSAA